MCSPDSLQGKTSKTRACQTRIPSVWYGLRMFTVISLPLKLEATPHRRCSGVCVCSLSAGLAGAGRRQQSSSAVEGRDTAYQVRSTHTRARTHARAQCHCRRACALLGGLAGAPPAQGRTAQPCPRSQATARPGPGGATSRESDGGRDSRRRGAGRRPRLAEPRKPVPGTVGEPHGADDPGPGPGNPGGG